jgi:hypothetical protein
MDFRLLRGIPEETENGLFITGDFAQKLFAKELDFSRIEMGPKARDLRSIRKNYRNSRQILLAGNKLLEEWPPAIGKDEELAILNPELADRDSAPPIAMKCEDQIAQAWREAHLWLSQGHVAFSVCIATVDPDQLSPEEILETKPPHIEADALSGNYMLNPSRVIVSDIASVKGFEFSLIIVLGLEEGLYPPKGRAENEQWRDALRLYVAITRGRDEVRFLYSAEPSKFLKAMGNTVSWQESEELAKVICGDDETTSDDEVGDTVGPVSSPDDLAAQAAPPVEGVSSSPNDGLGGDGSSRRISEQLKPEVQGERNVREGTDTHVSDPKVSSPADVEFSTLNSVRERSDSSLEFLEERRRKVAEKRRPKMAKKQLSPDRKVEKAKDTGGARNEEKPLNPSECASETTWDIQMSNGFPVAIVNGSINQLQLANMLGQPQTEIALHLQNRHQHYVRPNQALPKHIVIDLCHNSGFLVNFRG